MTQPADEPWHESALCRRMDPEIWFPDKGERKAAREAKEICRGCPVREECLLAAIARCEEHGIWGGMSRKERYAEKRRRNLSRPARTHCDKGHELERVGRRADGRCAECIRDWDRARRRDGGAA
jgi:WhiB family transcriptional regulator, redox-sensing transcriptional regulator